MTVERLNYMAINNAALKAMMQVKVQMTSIDAGLRALVETRISQINGCAFCVDTHLKEARAEGISQQRLDCLVVWRECDFYSPAECAALAWAEALTLIPDQGAPEELYSVLGEHFSDQQIVDLGYIIALMNAWNRLAMGFGHRPSAQP